LLSLEELITHRVTCGFWRWRCPSLFLVSGVDCNRKKLFTCQQEAYHVSNCTQTFAFRMAMPGHPGKEADWQSYSQVVHNRGNPLGAASETAVPPSAVLVTGGWAAAWAANENKLIKPRRDHYHAVPCHSKVVRACFA